MHHKRKRPKNRRAGCLMCKPWKASGYCERKSSRMSDVRRMQAADAQIRFECK